MRVTWIRRGMSFLMQWRFIDHELRQQFHEPLLAGAEEGLRTWCTPPYYDQYNARIRLQLLRPHGDLARDVQFGSARRSQQPAGQGSAARSSGDITAMRRVELLGLTTYWRQLFVAFTAKF